MRQHLQGLFVTGKKRSRWYDLQSRGKKTVNTTIEHNGVRLEYMDVVLAPYSRDL